MAEFITTFVTSMMVSTTPHFTGKLKKHSVYTLHSHSGHIIGFAHPIPWVQLFGRGENHLRSLSPLQDWHRDLLCGWHREHAKCAHMGIQRHAEVLEGTCSRFHAMSCYVYCAVRVNNGTLGSMIRPCSETQSRMRSTLPLRLGMSTQRAPRILKKAAG